MTDMRIIHIVDVVIEPGGTGDDGIFRERRVVRYEYDNEAEAFAKYASAVQAGFEATAEKVYTKRALVSAGKEQP